MAVGQPFYTNQSFNGYASPYTQPYQPIPYQNVIQPQYPQQQIQQAANANDQIWVASEAAAEAYPIAPNGFIRLWDSNRPCYYEKRSDPTGKPYPMVIYDYTIRGAAPQQNETAVQDASAVSELEKRIAALEERINALEKPSAASEKAQSVQNNKREDNRR